MIDYYGPYQSRLGGAAYLGVDAVIVPVPAAPSAPPGVLPQGPQTPAPEPPPGGLAPVQDTTLFGSKLPVVPVAIATVLTIGLIAAAGATTKAWKKGR